MSDFAAPAVSPQTQLLRHTERGCLACGSTALEYLGQGESADYCDDCCPPLCPACGGDTNLDCSRRAAWRQEKEKEANRPSDDELKYELFETNCTYERAREVYKFLHPHAYDGWGIRYGIYIATMGGSLDNNDESIQFTSNVDNKSEFARPNRLATEICSDGTRRWHIQHRCILVEYPIIESNEHANETESE